MYFAIMKLAILAAMLAIGSKATAVRRDDKWPPPILKSYLKTMHDSCVEKTGVAEETIVRFSDGDVAFDDDEKLKCYTSCLFEEAGLTDADGFLHLEKLVGAAGVLDSESEMTFLRMAKRCLRPTKSTQCETAFWYNKCWKESDPVNYFLL